MEKIDIPYIEGLEKQDYRGFESALELKGQKGIIDRLNWPDEFPYRPLCHISIAHSDKYIAILYHVRGLDLRAVELQDNGNIWEDSCCEFFVRRPEENIYSNFEMNCIGKILGATGEGRNNRVKRSEDQLKQIIRYSSLQKQSYDKSDEVFSWDAAMLIPFSLLGYSKEEKPETLYANFYKCGDKTSHPHFLSYFPIKCKKPDFHRPEFFGKLILKW